MQDPAKRSMDDLQRIAERIRGRRTVKLYLQTPVERQLVRDAIEVARWAPNHHLTEPWHFYILGEQTIARCADLTRIVVTERKGPEAGEFKAQAHGAIPGWLVVSCHRSDDELLQREDYASCCCAIQNLMLYLSEAGVARETLQIGIPDRFIEHGSREECLSMAGLDTPGILDQIRARIEADTGLSAGSA